MSIVVQKYGGSSVASLEKMRKVAEHIKKIKESGKQVVVVISPMVVHCYRKRSFKTSRINC
jgi:aspartate kinase